MLQNSILVPGKMFMFYQVNLILKKSRGGVSVLGKYQKLEVGIWEYGLILFLFFWSELIFYLSYPEHELPLLFKTL